MDNTIWIMARDVLRAPGRRLSSGRPPGSNSNRARSRVPWKRFPNFTTQNVARPLPQPSDGAEEVLGAVVFWTWPPRIPGLVGE